MSLEKRIASVARTIFLPELSFAANRFPCDNGEYELADHIVWVDDLLIAFQMKERQADLPEASWFENKVLKKATRQVRNTLTYLGQHEEIALENQRGHRFTLTPAKLARKFMVVVYDEPPSILYRARSNHHLSSTAGLIHLLRTADLIDVCRTLITLSEIASYLEFRDRIVRGNSLLSVPSWDNSCGEHSANCPMSEMLRTSCAFVGIAPDSTSGGSSRNCPR